eukprot:gene2383-3188_t
MEVDSKEAFEAESKAAFTKYVRGKADRPVKSMGPVLKDKLFKQQRAVGKCPSLLVVARLILCYAMHLYGSHVPVVISRYRNLVRATWQAAKLDVLDIHEQPGHLEAPAGMVPRQITQQQIRTHLDAHTSRKQVSLRLDKLGPYRFAFSRNGRSMVLGGRLGHMAIFNWKNFKLFGEVQHSELIRDVCFLHDDQMLAAAQRHACDHPVNCMMCLARTPCWKYVYIYDNHGQELHQLKRHSYANRLVFLPQHMLLASIGQAGILTYQDVSTGVVEGIHKTRLGECDVMSLNPWNGIVLCGHRRGEITLWAPKANAPLVKMLGHLGPVSGLAADRSGRFLVSTGTNHEVKVWDLRKFQVIDTYTAIGAPASVDISDIGMVSYGFGNRVEVWKDMFSQRQSAPYMVHKVANDESVSCLRFCPHEDILGIGHQCGLSTAIIPGSSEPKFDTYVANPFETQRQRREMPVRMLLDKLPAHMIALDPESLLQLEVPKSKKAQQGHKHLQQRQATFNEALAAPDAVQEADAVMQEDDADGDSSKSEGEREGKSNEKNKGKARKKRTAGGKKNKGINKAHTYVFSLPSALKRQLVHTTRTRRQIRERFADITEQELPAKAGDPDPPRSYHGLQRFKAAGKYTKDAKGKGKQWGKSKAKTILHSDPSA